MSETFPPVQTMDQRPLAAQMTRLLAKARSGQWGLDCGLDWDRGPDLPRWWPRKPFAEAVSHLRYGEQATLEFCRAFLGGLEDPTMAACIKLQVEDEKRHAAVYDRYLEGLGECRAPQPGMVEAYQAALAWQGPVEARVLAYHVVLEGEALDLHALFARRVPCALFRTASERILRDEARHVAFGRLFLQRRLARLSREERIRIYRWIKMLWWRVARNAAAGALGIQPGVLQLLGSDLDARWHRQVQGLCALGLIGRTDLAAVEPSWRP